MRRLAAAGLSALIPGLGQLFNGRRRLAALFLIPSLILLALGALIVGSQSGPRLAAWVVSPQVLGTLLALNMLLLAWRLVAVGQAFLDTRRTGPTGRLGIVGLVVIAILVVAARTSSSIATGRSSATRSTASSPARSSARPRSAAPAPARSRATASGSTCCSSASDKRGKRTANLTDTMMVASLDPVGHTVSHRVDPARPDRHAARQRRRVRAQAQLADALRGQPPEGLPEGRHAHARGRDRRAARHPDPLLRAARLRRLHQDGRCGRRRRRQRDQGRSTTRPTTASGSRARASPIAAGPHHLDGANAAGLRPVAQGASARATSPGRPASSRSCSPCATRRRVAAACCSSCPTCSTPSATRSARTCRSTSCRTSPRSWRRSVATTSRASSSARRWSTRRRPVTATRRRPTWPRSGRWRRSCSPSPARRPLRGRPRSRPRRPRRRRSRRRPRRRSVATDAAGAQNPSAASRGAIRRAARARCEIAFFSAGVHRPSVRPPGGSDAGSKIGS